MRVYRMSSEGLSEEIGKGKELFVQAMFDEGVISADQKNIMDNYSVVVARKGFFGSLWDKIFKEDTPYFFVVKVVKPSLSTNNLNDEEE